jgi:hypothetical protein
MKGHLQRRGESWRFKYDIGPDAAGNRQVRYVTLKGTKAEAQKAAAKILATVATGAHVDPSGNGPRLRRTMAHRLGERQRLAQDLDPIRRALAQAPLRPVRRGSDPEA